MDMPFDVLTTLMISATTVEIQVYDVVCTDAVIREHPVQSRWRGEGEKREPGRDNRVQG